MKFLYLTPIFLILAGCHTRIVEVEPERRPEIIVIPRHEEPRPPVIIEKPRPRIEIEVVPPPIIIEPHHPHH